MAVSLVLGLAALADARELLDDHDTTGWAQVAGQGTRFRNRIGTKVDGYNFRDLINAGCTDADKADRSCIVRRICDSCSSDDHVDIYYKRISPLPENTNFLNVFLSDWNDKPKNTMHVDFELYSTYEDAIRGENKWMFCNFSDGIVGFPRDCGPNGPVGHQWNSYVRGGGTAKDHGFYVETRELSAEVGGITEASPTREEVQEKRGWDMLHAELLAALGREPTNDELNSSMNRGLPETMRKIRRRGGHLANDSYAEKRWRSAKYVSLRKELRQERQAARKARREN